MYDFASESTPAGIDYAPIGSRDLCDVVNADCGRRSDAVRLYDLHEHLFFDGDEICQIYEIIEGYVCVYKLMSDGRRQVISFGFPGDLVGFSVDQTHRFSAEAITMCRARAIPMQAIDKLVEDRPDFSRKLLRFAAFELANAREQLLTVARKSATEKLATFLVALIQRHGHRTDGDIIVELPMTRTDIADYLGLTIETVSRVISKFRRAGLIELTHPTTVRVVDMDRLRGIAEIG